MNAWLRNHLGWLLLPALMGCGQGYPDEDEPLIDPLALNSTQRLELLNDIGLQLPGGELWRYSLGPACRLEVERHEFLWIWERSTHPLHDAEVRIGADGPDGNWVLQLAPSPGAQETTVMTSARRTDVLRAATLMRLLKRDCQPAP